MEPIEEKFVRAAREFCAWAEGKPGEDEDAKALSLLSGVYQLGLSLPFPPPIKEELGPEVSPDDSDSIYRRFASVSVSYYSECADPLLLENGEVVIGDVHDDLRDIYVDLKEGLLLHDSGEKQDAQWTWKNSFQSHWGSHATAAIHVLHRKLFGP